MLEKGNLWRKSKSTTMDFRWSWVCLSISLREGPGALKQSLQGHWAWEGMMFDLWMV